jgi:DNA replication and repair protein RecF
MRIQRLVLTHFRNFSFQEIFPKPGLNWITGPNGSGKTALLEAIYFLSTARSHRVGLPTRLIAHSADEFSLFAELYGETSHGIGVSRHRTEAGRVRLDQKNQNNHLEIAKLLPVLMLNPEGFGLFTEGSKNRRNLMDWGVFYSEPDFYGQWSAAKRILAQRNAGLKAHLPSSILNLFDEQLIQAAEKLDQYRGSYLQKLKIILKRLIGDFLEEHEVQMSYSRGWSKEGSLKDLLQEHFLQDQANGFTSQGPHRSDLKFKVGRIPVQDVLSRGEQKLLICAVKIAQGILFHEETGQQPIYLIDDLASELDRRHQKILLGHLEQLKAQAFLTAIEKNFNGENLLISLAAHQETGAEAKPELNQELT